MPKKRNKSKLFSHVSHQVDTREFNSDLMIDFFCYQIRVRENSLYAIVNQRDADEHVANCNLVKHCSQQLTYTSLPLNGDQNNAIRLSCCSSKSRKWVIAVPDWYVSPLLNWGCLFTTEHVNNEKYWMCLILYSKLKITFLLRDTVMNIIVDLIDSFVNQTVGMPWSTFIFGVEPSAND